MAVSVFDHYGFVDANGVTFGRCTNLQDVTASVVTNAISAGTVSQAAGVVVFSNSNNVSFGMSGSTVTATATIAGATPVAISAGTASAALGTVVFSNSNGVSFGLNGSTVTVSYTVPTATTLSTYEPTPANNTGTGVLSYGTNTSATATFIGFNLPVHVAVGTLALIHSVSFVTMGTSSGRQTAVQSFGLYSRGTGANNTTMSVVTSVSLGISVTYNNSTITVSQATATNSTGYGYGSTTSAGLNISSGYTGLKLIQLPVNSTLAPGYYWLGLLGSESSNSNSGGVRQSVYGNAFSLTGLAPMGSFSSAWSTGTNVPLLSGGNWCMGNGQFTSANQTNLPNTLAFSALTANVSVLPYLKLFTTV